jgi:ATP-dependent DNA helicase RecQ
VVLLSGREDDAIADYFITGAFPPEEVMNEVFAGVEEHEGASVYKLQTVVNAKEGEIKQALKILEVEGAVTKENGGWSRTVNKWKMDQERIEAVTETRWAELAGMQAYVTTGDCLMRYLTRELDDPGDKKCGRCANCRAPFLSTVADPQLVQEAVLFLKRGYRPIKPRKQWPYGLAERRGKIPAEHQLEEGRALALYGDAGWGTLVKEGKTEHGRFSDELVEAVAAMIEAELAADPAPTWVTTVPSRRHPELVPDFARRLAERLDLPYREALQKIHETPPQKTMENNVQQARNVVDAFAVDSAEIMEGPVLLVDDMVDSRWSITVCGVLLREAGSGSVYPIALGETTSGAGE